MKSLLGLGFGVVFVVLGGWVGAEPPNDAPPPDLSELVFEASSPLGAADCGACIYCSAGNDKVETEDSPNLDYLDHPCDFGETCFMPACPGGEEQLVVEEVREAWEVASAGTASDIVALVDAHPANVSLNEERGSLQMTGCFGLIANIPLSDEVIRDLGLVAAQK
jgi:hypothetical protein